MVCATLFIPSILIDSYPASDDISILAVILPATTREQHCSTERHPTTDTDWSSAATGNLQGPFAHWFHSFASPYYNTNFLLCIFFLLAFFLNLFLFFWILLFPFFPLTLPLCMLHIPAWLLVLGQWSKSSYHVSSTQRRASILPLSVLVPLCSAGTFTEDKTNVWVMCKAFGLHHLKQSMYTLILEKLNTNFCRLFSEGSIFCGLKGGNENDFYALYNYISTSM